MEVKKKRRKWPAVLIVILLLLGAAVVFGPRFMPEWFNVQTKSVISAHTVARGDIHATITSSGRLETQDSLEIKLPEGVKIASVFVKKGDLVAAGTALAALDQASLQYRAAELSAELTALDRELSTRRLNGTIKAPMKGRIKYLPASVNEDVISVVNQYGMLALLSTDEKMQLTISTEINLPLGTKVSVRWASSSETGKVISRVTGGYVITLDDDRAPYLARAEAYYQGALIGGGWLLVHAPIEIFGNGGTIKTIHFKNNDRVDANATLFTLDNEPATDAYRLKLADRAEKAEHLQTILRYQNSPNIVAESAGMIGDILVEEGEKTIAKDDSGELTAFTLRTGGATKLVVNVDELDINRVAVGMRAAVTLDAFADEDFTATVVRISHAGDLSGSITTYQTELRLEGDERLMDGMNGSAVIMTNSAQDVLTVPLKAVHEDAEGAYVYRLDGEDAQSRVNIKTGLSDGTNAEIVEGLREGDRIVYEADTTGGMMFPPFMNRGQGSTMPFAQRVGAGEAD